MGISESVLLIIKQIVDNINTKNKKILQKVLTSTKSRVIINLSNEGGKKHMSKKKKSGKDNTLAQLVLATSIIQLIQAIIELIEHLLE